MRGSPLCTSALLSMPLFLSSSPPCLTSSRVSLAIFTASWQAEHSRWGRGKTICPHAPSAPGPPLYFFSTWITPEVCSWYHSHLPHQQRQAVCISRRSGVAGSLVQTAQCEAIYAQDCQDDCQLQETSFFTAATCAVQLSIVERLGTLKFLWFTLLSGPEMVGHH